MWALESDRGKNGRLPPCTPSPGTPADAPGGVLTQHSQQAQGSQQRLLGLHAQGLLLLQSRQVQHPWVRLSAPRVSLSGGGGGAGRRGQGWDWGAGSVGPASPTFEVELSTSSGKTTCPGSNGCCQLPARGAQGPGGAPTTPHWGRAPAREAAGPTGAG